MPGFINETFVRRGRMGVVSTTLVVVETSMVQTICTVKQQNQHIHVVKVIVVRMDSRVFCKRGDGRQRQTRSMDPSPKRERIVG